MPDSTVVDTLTIQMFHHDAIYIVTDTSANVIDVSTTWILLLVLLVVGALLFKS